MTLVSTTIRTPDNQRLILPNNKIWGDISRTLQPRISAVSTWFSVSDTTITSPTLNSLKDIVQSDKDVLGHPEAVVRIGNLGESSVDFFVRPWVKTIDYWEVRWRITRTVKERFDAEGIGIPFPQREIHIVDKPAPA